MGPFAQTRRGWRRRGRTCGWVACALLGLGAAAGAAPATPPPATYQQAQARFDANDPAGALSLLERVPTQGLSDRERADLANLRGAIALRQRQYDKAREEFAAAAAKDPHLWAARYNEAEVSFRRGKYDEASRQFGQLLGETHGVLQGRERRFTEYKHLLADLLAGREQPARDFVAEHRGDKNPPLSYYYLNAALEERHGQAQKGGQWLTQADGKYPPAAKTVFAESFQDLGWPAGHAERLVAVVNDEGKTPAPKPTPGAKNAASSPETPGKPKEPAPKPAFRTETDAPPVFRAGGPAARDVNGQMPPVVDAAEPQTLIEDAADTRAGAAGPAVLGKPSSGHRATPTPSPAPSASPSPDSAASPAPTASPDASASPSPGGTPAPAFVQKYEDAYVKYLQKDYQGAKALLDEADIIQPGQKSSADLRDLIFKAYYEAGYVSFRKGDYPTALEQLGNADGIKPNNPDALNLRGLVLSRQRDYEHAEAAFKKASQLDPSFYAAKFNYAELPFNYKNYPVARARFEELFSQTDPAKQPVEAEITQFKVFLTLLLQGNVVAARAFMDHFTFTGATPARYFCQAALDFYDGNTEKAEGWINSASKEFKPQLVSIFKESFYRIGWMTDVNGQATFAGAPGAPATPGPGASPAAPAPAVALATPVASALPSVALAIPAASATPAGSPAAVLALNNATPRASLPAAATPAATPAASVAAAGPQPTPIKPPGASAAPTASKPPAAATPVPTAAPRATPVPTAAAATPLPTARATPVPSVSAAATATPAPSAAGATPALAKVSPAAEEPSTPPADDSDETPSTGERFLQLILGGLIVIPTIANILLILRADALRKQRMLARRKTAVYSDSERELEPEEAETPR